MPLFPIAGASVRLNIRSKLLLVSLALLVIPIVGYKYIRQMENYLRHEQEKSLLENARVVAAVIQSYPEIFRAHETSDSSTPHLYIRPLKSAIQVDGYADDWIYYQDRIMSSGVPGATQTGQAVFRFRTGHFGRYFYGLFQIRDRHVVYRQGSDAPWSQSDSLQIALADPKGVSRNYIIAAHSPGRASAHEVFPPKTEKPAHLENRIQANWQETAGGYNIELRIPLSMLGDKLSFAVTNVDDATQWDPASLLLEPVTTISIATPQIEQVLQRIVRDSSRIWLLNKHARVIAAAGDLTAPIAEPGDMEPFMDISLKQVIVGIVRLFYQLLLPQPAQQFQDDLSNASVLHGEEIASSLMGNPATQWRQTPDARVNILTATYPAYDNGALIGAVAVEETSNSVLILQNKAIEILINVSVLGFIFAMLILIGFATYLSVRIRRLRDNAEHAISPDGKVKPFALQSASSDEIGDLTRSFAGMLDRLANYNRYLETMAGKLSHELRTPITVVKSSLENLEHGQLDKQNAAYVERARDGIERLNGILTRMSEATRLEQTLQQEQISVFDIEAVVASCIEGYRLARPEQAFEFHSATGGREPLVKGAPDLIAQMLDKLISNAVSFTKTGAPIHIGLQRLESHVILKVSNEGPLLPSDMQSALFDSMVSIRQKKDSEPHLGLGLYIVRLIAEFHHGEVSAANRRDVQGVEFSVKLPLS